MSSFSFDNFDKFDRRGFASRLTDTINRFYPFYSEAFVLSLNAPFGSGKTTFLKMWKHSLESGEKPYKVIYVNAWETDFDDEPIVPIISALLESLGKGEKPLQTKLKKTLGTVVLAANNVLAHNTGLDLVKASEDVEAKIDAQSIQNVGEEIFKEYSFKRDAFIQLKTALSEYVAKQDGKPIIILVDELDRARPNYSVKFLETIKHIFSVKGICFVLAVDKKQLQRSVCQIYGEVDFENYYRRFITREANLPRIEGMSLLPYLNGLSLDFFDNKVNGGMKFVFNLDTKQSHLEFIEFTAKTLKFVPREIEAFFRIFTQFMISSDRERVARPIWVSASILLIALSIKDSDLYEEIGTTYYPIESIYKYFSDKVDKNKRLSSYLLNVVLSFSTYNNGYELDNSDETFRIVASQNGVDVSKLGDQDYKTKKHEALSYVTRGLDSGFGDYPDEPLFREIYARIEEWKDFFGA